MSDFDYDLFVIGGGSGGVRAGRVAAENGAKVALAEEFRMGGTCVIRGCVPKKLMVFASKFGPMTAEARDFGWEMEDGTFDWLTFRPKLHQELTRLENIYRTNLARPGTDIFDARASVKDAHTVELSNGRSYTAKHILVATGGRPFIPDIPGCELGITSNEIFNLDHLPKKILIVGGGYIACEFACILNGLGVDVTLWHRGPQVLRGFDDEVRGHISELMVEQGIDVRVGVTPSDVERRDDGRLRVNGSDDHHVTVNEVLWATGRKPNSDDIGLEEVGVELDRNGAVKVDDYSQTAVPSIFAVGDVTDRIALTPVAIREGAAFVETVFKGNPTKPDHELVASAVFTQPEYGTVGMTEEEAREKEKIDVYCAAFRPMQKSFIDRTEKALFKLIVSQKSQKVLGVHIVADGAGEMIQLAAVAVKMGATKADFDAAVAVHPTMAEEIVLMKTPTRAD
ncbi:glutathione-disulfide reductase [Maritimibacter dapengensis]|uniref:Glutathione reductase n=1 Tax=Maritimibacter dapengensis TaxID=2836868 RepID=A0ABS6SZ58_9RHOB|nr:glutathione-disulfide reductase [Maritimibacter dapengensis]MBV7378262.1 glutathione-disulfide reductase [Maritimibacter dapengensis]